MKQIYDQLDTARRYLIYMLAAFLAAFICAMVAAWIAVKAGLVFLCGPVIVLLLIGWQCGDKMETALKEARKLSEDLHRSSHFRSEDRGRTVAKVR